MKSHLIIILLPSEIAMFGKPFRYLEQYQQCLENFLRAFKIEIFLKNSNSTKNFDPLLETCLHTTTIVCFLSETFFSNAMRKLSKHCTVMLYVCKRLPNSNCLQRQQNHEHMALSSWDIKTNIGKMRETLKSELGRDHQRLKFFVRLAFLRKTLFLKALRNFSRHCMILF